MELTVPAQTFIASHVHVGSPSKHVKPIATLSYKDDMVSMPCFSLLLPPLAVKSYDSDTGKLALSLLAYPAILAKLVALQGRILQTITENYTTWFPTENARSLDETAAAFQPLIQNNAIHLYCPTVTTGSFNEIGVYSGTEWSRGVIPTGMLAPGKIVRAAVRLQSVSFHQHPVSKALTGRFRIQHRILALFKC
jgi:hypothetical protein